MYISQLFQYSQYENIITNKTFSEFCDQYSYIDHDVTSPITIDEVHGQVAFSGNVCGTIRLVRDISDIQQFQPGEILVTSMTNATWLPAIIKSIGIITDEGGITCHAAIMARELQIPCITGTKIATKIFKNGDKVEINGETGVVTKT